MHQIHESNDKLVNTKEFRKQKAYKKRLLRTTVKNMQANMCLQVFVCKFILTRYGFRLICKQDANIYHYTCLQVLSLPSLAYRVLQTVQTVLSRLYIYNIIDNTRKMLRKSLIT